MRLFELIPAMLVSGFVCGVWGYIAGLNRRDKINQNEKRSLEMKRANFLKRL